MKTFYIPGMWGLITAEDSSTINFECLNGGWFGVYHKDTHMVEISDVSEKYAGDILWRGEVPEEYAEDYNSAIDWIESQISPAQES